MSTTCALMSSSPSSNTANSPAGPPPTIRASISIGAGTGVPSTVMEGLLRLTTCLLFDMRLLGEAASSGQPAIDNVAPGAVATWFTSEGGELLRLANYRQPGGRPAVHRPPFRQSDHRAWSRIVRSPARCGATIAR